MTVAELIAALQTMPQGALVCTWAPDETCGPTSGPELTRMSPRGIYSDYDYDPDGVEVVII